MTAVLYLGRTHRRTDSHSDLLLFHIELMPVAEHPPPPGSYQAGRRADCALARRRLPRLVDAATSRHRRAARLRRRIFLRMTALRVSLASRYEHADHAAASIRNSTRCSILPQRGTFAGANALYC
jgi:hypothetical protein